MNKQDVFTQLYIEVYHEDPSEYDREYYLALASEDKEDYLSWLRKEANYNNTLQEY